MNLNTVEGMADAMLWQQSLIDTIHDGGTWIVPRSGTMYTFHKTEMKVVRVGLMPEPDIDRVLRKLGWNVVS